MVTVLLGSGAMGSVRDGEGTASEQSREVQAPAARVLVFMRSRDGEPMTVENLVATIKEHVRRERAATRSSASDPTD